MGKKRILISMGIFVAIIALIGIYVIYVYKPAPTKEQLSHKFSEFETKYQEKKAGGYDVTEAEEFARKAKEAFDRENYKTASKLLDEAFETLQKARIPAILEAVKEEAKARFSRIKVASLYEKVTDGALIERNTDDVINLLNETKTNFIFRGFWIWHSCPENCSQLPLGYTLPKGYTCEEAGYSYEHLRDAISEIKKEIPDVIFCGAIPAQCFNTEEIDPLSGEGYDEGETWDMALDPAKWGIDISKEKTQQYFQNGATGAGGYFPDITNPDFQDFFLNLAKKQIDCGADAIWIDMLFSQARLFERITGDPEHPAVKESFEAASRIVDEIHKYGYSRHGKYIYVGTWWTVVELPYTQPNLDFVTISPSPQEIKQKNLDQDLWETRTTEIRGKLGDIPIFAFIDWAGDNAPTAVFSQKLNKEEQRELLKKIDEFFQKKRIIYIYPIHGGFMGGSAKITSFGKYKIYDSLAPEFETYETIKELAMSKAGA